MALRRAAPAAFYDSRLARTDSSLDAYRPLFRAAAALLPAGRVVELGCGTGRFAAFIGERDYVGLDFAPGHIEAARRYQPDCDFRVADLRTDPIPPADAYVALEVLEHLDDDLGLLRRLPSAATVVLSVPSFDSASHVRFFVARGSAAARYGPELAIDTVRYVELKRGAYFHLLRGTRR
jgi:trans-aconitate methyltransferase